MDAGDTGIWVAGGLFARLIWTAVVLIIGIELNFAIWLVEDNASSWKRQVVGGVVHALGAGLVLVLAGGLRLTLAELGLEDLPSSCGTWCAGVGGAVALGFVGAAILGYASKRSRDARYELSGWHLAAKILILIPATVIFEELAFRGVLYGLWEESSGPVPAIAASAIAFGLWHVMPAIDSARANPGLERTSGGTRFLIVKTVLFTCAGGVLFGILRYQSGCLWTPAMTHWGANAAGVLTIAVAAKRRKHNRERDASRKLS